MGVTNKAGVHSVFLEDVFTEALFKLSSLKQGKPGVCRCETALLRALLHDLHAVAAAPWIYILISPEENVVNIHKT